MVSSTKSNPLHYLCPPRLLAYREQALSRGCNKTAHRALITIKAAMWICQCYITQIEAVIFKKEAGVLEYDLFFQEVKISSFQLIILCQTKEIISKVN